MQRVCVRAERRDVVVAQSQSGVYNEVPLITRRWTVITSAGYDKYNGCSGDRVGRSA